MTATTCYEFFEYDTKISVYCNGCIDPVCVVGNDDNCAGFGGLLSTVNWCSEAGTEYLILVHGFGSATGGFDLSVFDDGGACDTPGNGDYCVSHGSPGCDDVECCKTVCAIDPFCRTNVWDGICADEATDLLILFANWGPCP